jgi:hypothetical protein
VRTTRTLLYSLPVLTVGVVGFATLVVGAPRPYWGARLFGGPVEGSPRLSWQLQVVERIGEAEAPAPARRARVDATLANGRTLTWQGAVDASGMASVSLEPDAPPGGPVSVHVVSTEPKARELGSGRVSLSRDTWLAGARRQGGWVDGKGSGALRISVAPGRGVFAVPFYDPLLIQVRDERGAVGGAQVKLSPDGLDVKAGGLVTDEHGRVRVQIAPREHVVSLRVTARREGDEGTWFGALPVVPGALHARLNSGKLWIESPIVHERAYFAILDESARLAGDSVALTPDARGGSGAIVDAPDFGARRLWCVVSSESDLASPGLVGWPLGEPGPDAPPPRTFAVADHLLLDGLLAGYRAETERRARARLIAAVFAVGAALLAAALMMLEARDARARLGRHLSAAGSDDSEVARVSDSSRRLWVVAVGVLGVMLGFLFLALLSMMGLG